MHRHLSGHFSMSMEATRIPSRRKMTLITKTAEDRIKIKCSIDTITLKGLGMGSSQAVSDEGCN